LHGVRAAIPKTSPLASCEFTTIRERLIKIGAGVIEHIARIRVQLPTICPEAALFRTVALGLMPSGREWRGSVPRSRRQRQINLIRVARRVTYTDPAGRIAGARPSASRAKNAPRGA
jgi:hypothetical protein